MAVRALETSIDIEQRLHVVVAGWKFAHGFIRIAQCKRVERGGLAGLQTLYVGSNEFGVRPPRACLQTRLRIIGARDDDKKPSGKRLLLRCRQSDLEGNAGGK